MITRKPKTIWTALIAAVILSAVFVGCTFTGADESEKQSAPSNSETGTAAASVNESGAIVPEQNMWMYDLLFADGFYQKDVTATGCAICKDGVQVGGIQNITLSEETLADPVLGEGVAEVLKNDVMPKIAEGDFDYMISGSNRGILAEASFANREKEYSHYVFQNLSGCYDLWVDGSMVDFQLESKILEAVLNPGKVPNELLALKLNLTVPEGMRLFDSKDNSCEILKSISDRVGGICALPLSPDALSNPSSEDVKNAVTSMKDVMRLEMNAYEAVKGTDVPVEITTKDDYYTYHHYIFDIDSDVYDLWLVMENTTKQERDTILDTVLK